MKWSDKISRVTERLQLGLERFDAGVSDLFKVQDHTLRADFGSKNGFLSRRNGGMVLNGYEALSLKDSLMGVGIFGQTGSGKSSVVINPCIFHNNRVKSSLLIHDPARPIYNETSGYLSERGVDVKVIDLENAYQSCGINFFPKTLDATLIAQQVDAALRSTLGTAGSEKFWYLASAELTHLLASLVFGLPEEYRHWPQVAHMLDELSGNPERFDKFVIRFAPSDHLFTEYKAHLNAPERTRMSVVMNCKAALKIFKDPNVARITSSRDLDFNDLRISPTAVYLVNNIANQSYYSGLSNMILTSFFSSVFERIPDPKSELPIFVLLDECSSLHLGSPSFSNYLNSVRKHLVSVTTLWQDMGQIEDIYGQGSSAILAGLRNKLWLPSGMDLKSAEYLSRTLGEYEYETDKGGMKKRLLRTPNELMQYPTNKAILTSQHHPPMELNLWPYYTNPRYRDYADIPPAPNTGTIINADVPLFDFNSL